MDDAFDSFFTPTEATRLRYEVAAMASENALCFSDLLEGWQSHVKRMHNESKAGSRHVATDWGADDLVASLHLRSFLRVGMGRLDAQLKSKVEAWVNGVDQEFQAFTTADEKGLIEAWLGEPVPSDWWWHRIPIAGPIVKELSEAASR